MRLLWAGGSGGRLALGAVLLAVPLRMRGADARQRASPRLLQQSGPRAPTWRSGAAVVDGQAAAHQQLLPRAQLRNLLLLRLLRLGLERSGTLRGAPCV